MADFRKTLSEMRRPSLLMRAVRHGLSDYQRGPWIKRLAPGDSSSERTVARLLSIEEEFEQNRRRGDSAYSITRHVEVLIALLAEARLLRPDCRT